MRIFFVTMHTDLFSTHEKHMTQQGKLIVIDGTDGSGKGTHAGMLIERLVRENRKVQLADFPQYGKASAFFVEKYLRGEYGALESIGAKKASLFYALDRYDASFDMRDWLASGGIIVSNRYVSSNMGHQAGKILDPDERQACIEWLKDLEYGILGLPKPDANILLYVPPEVGQQLVDKKVAREYTQGKKRDIHEAGITTFAKHPVPISRLHRKRDGRSSTARCMGARRYALSKIFTRKSTSI
jgi:dTMP kinase